jgi:hypothetical protein
MIVLVLKQVTPVWFRNVLEVQMQRSDIGAPTFYMLLQQRNNLAHFITCGIHIETGAQRVCV